MNTRTLRSGWSLLSALALVLVCAQCRVAMADTVATQAVPTEAIGSPAAVNDAGRPDASTVIRVTFALNSANKANAAAYVESLSDPKSPNFHKWIKPAQFAKLFGASDSDISTVLTYLSSIGLTNVTVSPDKLFISAQAPRSQIESAFNVTIHGYSRAQHAVTLGLSPTYFAPDKQPSVPASVAPILSGIFGLSSAIQLVPTTKHSNLTPLTRKKSSLAPTSSKAIGGSVPNALIPAGSTPQVNPFTGSLDPKDLTKAYNITSLHSLGYLGQGEDVAIFSPTLYQNSDIQAFLAYNGISSSFNNINIIDVDGGAVNYDAQDEACLDIETIVGQAPKATINVYEGPNTLSNFDIELQIEKDDPQVLSTSWGIWEDEVTQAYANSEEVVRQAMAAEGISVFIATGDYGAYDPYTGVVSVQVDSASPSVTGVGGTELNLNTDGSWRSETAWTYNQNGDGVGGAGGLSIYYPEPSWQTGPGVANQYSDGERQVPDVSALAWTPFYAIYTEGGWYSIGGTSASTPLWSSAISLIGEGQGGSYFGNIDPQLYNLGAIDASVFHDITVGNNGVYPATPGWDFATGWGSVDFGLLNAALSSSFPPAATPVIIPNGGYSYNPPTITLTDSTPGVNLYYTTDGSMPSGSSTLYTQPFLLLYSSTINVIALGNGYSKSAVATATFTVTPQAPTPTISPASGVFTSAQTVILADTDTNATIYYTTDGSTPTSNSNQYTAPFTVSQSQTITAIAIDTNTYRNSNTASVQYTILPFTPTPVITPDGGIIPGAETVTITDSLLGASIYYFTTTSTGASSGYELYTGPLTVSGTETITAVATAVGYFQSVSASAYFTFSNPAPAPTITPGTGTYNTPQAVILTNAHGFSGTIYYTLDGSVPGTGSAVYISPIIVPSTETIKAISAAAGFTNSPATTAVITIIPAPTITPDGGLFAESQTVTIADAFVGSILYYTDDGTTPVVAPGDVAQGTTTAYSGPISVTAAETIKAIAVAPDYTNSLVTSAAFTVNRQAPSPTFTPGGEASLSGLSVAITDVLGPNASIYYTTDGSTPTTSSTLYTAPVQVLSTETIAAIVVDTLDSFANSDPSTATYTIGQTLQPPTYSIPAGPYPSAISVTLSDTVSSGVTFFYTTDGTTPAVNAQNEPTGTTAVYTGPISVTSSEAIRAFAEANGYYNSPASSAGYTIGQPVPSPVFTPASGAYLTPQTVTLSDTFPEAAIFFTSDGQVPVVGNGDTLEAASTTLSSQVPASAGSLPVSSISGFVINETVLIDGAGANPETATVTGIVSSPPSLTISTLTQHAHSANASVTVAFLVNATSSLTLEAIAVQAGYVNSSVSTATYSVAQTLPAPAISPNGGANTVSQVVTISDSNPNAKIYYSLDGSAPTQFSNGYTAAISLTQSTELRAIAIETGYASSPISSAEFRIGSTVNPPTISLQPGAYATAQSVTITDSSGSSIYYTTDGSTPTATSTLYSGPITVAASEKISAIGIESGYFNSLTATASYVIGQTVPTPTIAPNGGQFAAGQLVTLGNTLPNAVIYYTVDGSSPTASSTHYTGPFALAGSETVQAIAVETGYLNSSAALATFTVATPAPAPAASPSSGAIGSGSGVTLTDTLVGSTIYYTTDGSTPTTNSAVYSKPIVVTNAETINAIAAATGFAASSVTSETYTVTPAVIASYGAGLQLISLPESYSGVSLDSIFGYSGVKLAVWLAASNYYPITPTPPADEVVAGQGYWVRFPVDVTVTLPGTATPTSTPYVIPLHAGWNMVGDPFPSPVPLSSLTFSKGALAFNQAISGNSPLIGSSVYSYNSATNAYVNSSILEPTEGYWIFAYSATDLDVPVPAGA